MTVAFELLRFEATPVSASVAVVELDGVFDGPAPARVRLLVEWDARRLEVPALATRGEDPWTASFAVELAALDGAAFALVPGRGPLIALPEPTSTDAGDDRFVRLARQANALRHRLEEAVAASAARERVGDELATERDALRDELAAAIARADAAEATAAAARDQRDSADATAASAREELGPLREQLRAAEAQLVEAERDRAALRARAEAADRTLAELRETANASAEASDQEIADLRAQARGAGDAEAEVRTLRHELREARARIEALEREAHDRPDIRRGHEVVEDDAEVTQIAAEPPATDEATRTMPITAARRTKVVRLDDGEGADVDDRETRIVRRIEDLTIDTGDVLEPAAVGARFIEPAETTTPLLTPARILVGVALLVFVVVFAAILLGAGIV